MTGPKKRHTEGDEVSRLLEDRLREDAEFRREWERTADKRALAEQLVALRKGAGLTLRSLARRAGWSPSYVCRLESAGEPYPTLPTIARYIEACGERMRAGLVFAEAEGDHLHVVGGVTLHPAKASYAACFEQMQGTDVELGEEEGEEAQALPVGD